MNTTHLRLTAVSILILTCSALATPNNRNTDWLPEARYGGFMHFLPGDDRQLAQVQDFDVEALARQLETVGASYFVLTLGQNSGYFNSPNATYDRITGYAPSERCSSRDLPHDLQQALRSRGIRLMLYLPCQVPNQDARAQKAFGLPEGKQDQPIDLAFARKWATVIQEWSDRYGDKVAGWWFDGGYDHIHFNEAIAQIYATAVKHGNSNAIVTFNPGVKVVHHTDAEDYTAGELNEPFTTLPASRWLSGSQWHALTYLGSNWGQRDTRHPEGKWADWVCAVVAKGGAVTFDMGPNWNPQQGPIGTLAESQVNQLKVVQAAVEKEFPVTTGPKRLRRADSFLGVHFDFHAGPDCTEIGKNTTRAMIENVINQVRPDYLQIDCKGHPGLSSYPTKVGNRAPGFVGDPLRLWRQVTAEHGVALFMHYSGVWDSEAIRQHPTWAVINANGSTNGNATSFFSPYGDQLLIPQLRELAGDYRVDGAWVDGECWAAMPDYGEAALKAFCEATGITDVPRKASEPHWYEFLQFNRAAYRDYLRHYIAGVKQTNPEMQLCSNWAFTDHMPEAVCAPVDWLSGDYSPEDSVNSARFSARYLAPQGKPWDLMAWSFTTKPGKDGSNRKSVVQLQREAAVVLALGGGFQAYITQTRDGAIREEQIPTMAEVAKFCRARQAFCHHAAPVPQVAFLYSTAAHYREIKGLFNRDLSRLRGTLQALLESQQSVEILSEHNLSGRMAEYPLIVVPETDYLEPAFKAELIAYVEAGGNLLLIGPATAALFAPELGVTLEGSPQTEIRYLAHAGVLTPTKDPTKPVVIGKALPFGRLHASKDANSPSQPAATITSLGRGKIAATYFCFSRGYLGNRADTARGFLNDLTRQLFPGPLVEVSGSSDVDVAVNRLNGRLAINLVNTAGPHADVQSPIHDTIPPVGPLQLVVRTPGKPSRISLEPGGDSLPFDYQNGTAQFTVPQLDIHRIVVIE
ncbi:MAG: alpha-amylase family protein [Verrucomicrobiota bacterium]|nr:alpha-L-fucosidase [Limisphaerales bacterium]